MGADKVPLDRDLQPTTEYRLPTGCSVPRPPSIFRFGPMAWWEEDTASGRVLACHFLLPVRWLGPTIRLWIRRLLKTGMVLPEFHKGRLDSCWIDTHHDSGVEEQTTMAKKFGSGRCAHCLWYFDVLTSDHVFPLSWYPETTPSDLEKWQMPSCDECNKKYGKIENDLLRHFGLCLDGTQEAAKGIPQKAVRAISPKAGRDPKDSCCRQQLLQKTLREALKGSDVPTSAVLAGFGRSPSQDTSDAIGILVGVTELKSLAEKLVRGVTYISTERYIENDHEIETYFDVNQGAVFAEATDKIGTRRHCGPGIVVLHAVAPDDPVSGIFDFTLWGTFRFWVVVNPRGRD